jgi:uncharacterized OB-fold protein
MSGNAEWVELGTDAELLTFTHVLVTPTSFVDHDPYLVAIGRVKGGINILAWVEGGDPLKLKPGDKLRLESRKDEQGSPYYVFVTA